MNTAEHYDLLIDEENDPCQDPPELQAYMEQWDGPAFMDSLLLTAEKRVLEIGVGTGRLARQVAPRCLHVTGIDISAKTIQRAAENLCHYPNVTLICADFLTHTFSETYDVIYSSLTMMHFEDKLHVLRKVASLLTPGGLFCLSIDKNQDKWIDMGTRRLRIYPDHPMQTMAYITAAGLQIINQYETGFAHIFVCRR